MSAAALLSHPGWFNILLHLVIEDIWVCPPSPDSEPADLVEQHLQQHFWAFLGAHQTTTMARTLQARFDLYGQGDTYPTWLIASWCHLVASLSLVMHQQRRPIRLAPLAHDRSIRLASLAHDKPSPVRVAGDVIAVLAVFFGEQNHAQRLFAATRDRQSQFMERTRLKGHASSWLLKHLRSTVFPADRYRSHPVIRGALDLLATACIGETAINLFDDGVIEPETVAVIHRRWQRLKALLLEVAIAVAWADGKIQGAERKALREQIVLARLTPRASATLLKALACHERAERVEWACSSQQESSSRLDWLARYQDLTLGPTIARTVLAAAIVSAYFDGEQQESEQRLIITLAERLGLEAADIDMIEIELLALLDREPLLLRSDMGWFLDRFQSSVTTRLKNVIINNKDSLIKEIKETGDLSLLLTRVARGDSLTSAEKQRAFSQLGDIAKVIPSIAVLALPGGLVLLGVLIKLLPFNLLPSAFAKSDQHEDELGKR